MTIVAVDANLEELLTQTRTLAQVVVTVLLVAIILGREMVRGRSLTSAAGSGSALVSVALPLAVAWLIVAIQRAMAYLAR